MTEQPDVVDVRAILMRGVCGPECRCVEPKIDCGANRMPIWHTIDMALSTLAAAGYVVVKAPIPSVAALRELVRATRELDHFAWSMVSLPTEARTYLQSLIDAHRAALAAPGIKEIMESEDGK